MPGASCRLRTDEMEAKRKYHTGNRAENRNLFELNSINETKMGKNAKTVHN